MIMEVVMDNKEDDISIHTKEQIAANQDNIFEQAAKYEKKEKSLIILRMDCCLV